MLLRAIVMTKELLLRGLRTGWWRPGRKLWTSGSDRLWMSRFYFWFSGHYGWGDGLLGWNIHHGGYLLCYFLS